MYTPPGLGNREQKKRGFVAGAPEVWAGCMLTAVPLLQVLSVPTLGFCAHMQYVALSTWLLAPSPPIAFRVTLFLRLLFPLL